MQIKCGSDARRSAVRGSADWNGIDYLEVRTITEKNSIYKNPLIIVYCFKAASGLDADNVLFSGGVREKGVAAEWAYTASEVIASHQDKVSSGELQFLNTIESPANALVIRASSRGDFSAYTLSLVESADTPGTPPARFDIILSQVEFSFKVECPSEFDCVCIESHPSQQKLPEPVIDYMAKDFASFRKLMLDRLSLMMPDWKERNPADMGIMLVELLAYVGDHLSYYQDAVATEAYLGTARRRISAARHARLLDYPVNEGRNSRAWICFEVTDPDVVVLPRGTQLLTKTSDEKTTDAVIKVDLQEELIKGAEVFESMYKAALYKSKNKMSFYTWSETDCWLPAGSTSATVNGSGLDAIDVFVWENVPGSDTDKLTSYLASNFGLDWLDTATVEKNREDTVITISSGNKKELTITLQEGRATLAVEGKDLHVFQVQKDPDHKRLVKSSSLRVGDVLVFAEEMSSPSGGVPNLNHRHAVRVTSVAAGTDELTGVDVLEIEWDQKDALPFSLCLERDGKPRSAIYGNVVLADHGYTKKTEDISATTSTTATSNPFEERKFKDRVVAGKYYPRLDEKPLTRCGPDFEITAGKGGPATSAFDYDFHKVTPAITLVDSNSDSWEPAQDLFSGDEFAPIFVVETESDRTAYLRFSEQNRDAWARQINEGTFKGFTATYRIGNGSKGNVGAESITRATGASVPAGIRKVFNPMPARGGEDPETIESIRLHAPQAFRKQERAVTAADYEEVLKRHPGVQKAAAEKRWTGSWYTMFVAIDRKGGMDVDKEFEAEIVAFLEKYRLAGYDVEIQSPIYVPLKISIEVCLKDGYFWGEVKEKLLKVFSSKPMEDDGSISSSKGFFDPDKLTFGQTLYLSRVYEAALAVAGVSSIIITEFHRWGKEARGELDDGYIGAGLMEILRLDNDPNFAENGMIDFSFCGGGRGGGGA